MPAMRWVIGNILKGSVLWACAASLFGAETPRAQLRVERAVRFLPETRAERADLYAPLERRTPAPAVLVLHGGGFYGGSRDADREEEICRFLARAGYLVLSADYALSDRGQAVWPENLFDCKRAVFWLRSNAERLQVDPERIAVLGISAGGHLAAMLALTGPADGLEPPDLAGADCKVQACVDLYGPSDLTGLSRLSMLGPTRAEDPGLYRQASPVHFASPEDPPMLIVHGTADASVDPEHSRLLALTLKRAGVAAELEWIDGGGHGFGLDAEGAPGKRVLEFLARVLRK